LFTADSKIARSIKMKSLNIVALVLVVVGAVNWGLVGVFGFDLVAAIFGEMSVLSRIVYALVGIAGLYSLTLIPAVRRRPALAHAH
jgi:uncharacterized protein